MNNLIDMAFKIRKENFPMEVFFDKPDMTLAVSTSGNKCALSCSHCGKVHLKHMTPIDKAKEKVKSKCLKSILLSGGCSIDGSVMQNEDSLILVRQLKEEGFKLNLHTGLVNENSKYIEILNYADRVSFDFTVDDETIKKVYKINKTSKDFITSFKFLQDRVKVIPHVCIGLNGGQIIGEYKALEALKELKPEGLVFIIFTPTKGTEFANNNPPTPQDVAEIISNSRIMFPSIPIGLGCMRPGAKYRDLVDVLALQSGVNRIVNPSKVAVDLANDMGFDIKYGRECCVL